MTPQQKKKLEKLLKTLDESKALIRELLCEGARDESINHPPPQDYDARALLASLKWLERSAAEHQLSELKQHELGAIFAECGGPSTDKKKPKVWLVEQILWRIFDFERGHEAIRSKGANEN